MLLPVTRKYTSDCTDQKTDQRFDFGRHGLVFQREVDQIVHLVERRRRRMRTRCSDLLPQCRGAFERDRVPGRSV